MRKLFWIGLVLGLVALLGAPNPANAGATVTKVPFAFLDFVCNGEFVVTSGTWQFTTNIHSDSNGGFHLVDNWNIHGTGTGSLGNDYRLNYADNFTVHIGGDGLPFTVTNPFNYNLVSKGNAPNLKFQGSFKLHINENGDVIHSDLVLNVTCK